MVPESTPAAPAASLDVEELRGKVKEMYRLVAEEPQQGFHFELGRPLALRLGYPSAQLDRIPAEATESFAGVGYHLDLAALKAGETALDLGSGSGMDTFGAALAVGPRGRVIGVDMTPAQLAKASRLRDEAGFGQVEYRMGYLEDLPVVDATVDVVISNGVINLCADKARVFREVARVLRPGGRLAISDIVTEVELPEKITCNTTLWAACIGGAAQQDHYREALAEAGLGLMNVRDNPQYQFLTRSAQSASQEYGVKSVSLLAEKS